MSSNAGMVRRSIYHDDDDGNGNDVDDAHDWDDDDDDSDSDDEYVHIINNINTSL